MWTRGRILAVTAGAAGGLILAPTAVAGDHGQEAFEVNGGGTHFFSKGIVHSKEETSAGAVQQSTETVELTGDLRGYVLYHVTSEFDYVHDRLVNTGRQFFSGTVAGSAPVVMYDDEFRFEIDLGTGETTGEVHLGRSKDAADGYWYECDLEVVGTGVTDDGDGTFAYSGTCIRRGQR